MKKILWLAAGILFYVSPLFGQAGTTLVSATVEDTSGHLYVNCQWSAVFVGENTTPGAGPYLPSAYTNGQQGHCDSFGNFSVNLGDNINTMTPTPSQWSFSICSTTGYVGGPYCATNILITITGTFQDITSILTPLMPILPGTGGGGTPGGPFTAIQFNDSGNLGGSANYTFNKVTGVLALTGTITFSGSPYEDFNNSSAPSNPASGFCRRYYNSSTGRTTFLNSSGGYCGDFLAAGDLNGTVISQGVVGILNQPLPSLSTGCLQWSGSAWVFGTCGGGGGGGVGTSVVGQPAIYNSTTTVLGAAGPTYVVPAFNWVQTDSAGNIGNLSSSGTGKTLTLTPCPLGIDTSNNVNALYGVYIAGTGTPEAVPVTGGTCTSGGTSGTIIVTTANTHSAGFTVGAASGGIQEAINVADGGNSVNFGGGFPFIRVQLVPAGQVTFNYTVNWPIYFNTGKSVLDGYGAFLNCNVRTACVISGNYIGGTSGHNTFYGITFESSLNVVGAQIANVTAAAGLFTVNTASNHNLQTGDYAILYYSTPALTQEGRFQVTVTSATQFTYNVGASTFTQSNGYGWVHAEVSAMEMIGDGNKLVDIRLQGSTGKFNQGIVVGNDQDFKMDGGGNNGATIRCDANTCGNFVYLRGDQGAAPVAYISNVEMSMGCANGIRNVAGNTLSVTDSVIQAIGQYEIWYGGGLNSMQFSNVYNETGSCNNPSYPITTLAAAGIIAKGGGTAVTMTGNAPQGGVFPTFVTGGGVGSTLGYYVIAKDPALGGTGSMLFIGSAQPATGGTNIPLYWPDPDLLNGSATSGSSTRTFDILVQAGATPTSAPYTGNAFSIVTGLTHAAACGTNGLCTYTDTRAATTAYTVNPALWNMTLPFWPGSFVMSGGASLYMDQCGQESAIIVTSFLPKVFCKRGVIAGSNATYSPYWGVYPAGDSNGNANKTVGAMLLQLGPASGGWTTGQNGAIMLEPGPLNGVSPRQLLTTMDGVPSQTFATPGYARVGSSLDSFIGTSTTGATGTQDQSYGAPGGHNFFVNDPGTTVANAKFQILSANANLRYPLCFQGSSSGSDCIGAAAVAGSPSRLLFPAVDGANGQFLGSGTPGGGTNQMAWINPFANLNQYSTPYANPAGVLSQVNAPTGPNKVIQLYGYDPLASAAVAPALFLPGIVGRSVTSTTDTIGPNAPTDASDCNGQLISYTGTSAVAVTLPTPTTLGVPNCTVILANNTTQTVTVTPTTWTISAGSGGSANATLAVLEGQIAAITVDAKTATNWNAKVTEQAIVGGANITLTRGVGSLSIAATGSTGVTSITATAPVVVTPSPLITTGVVSCANCVDKTATNTATSSMTLDMSAVTGNSTLLAPSSAAAVQLPLASTPGAVVQGYTNDGSTGTVTGLLAKINGNNQLVKVGTSDTEASGIVVAGGAVGGTGLLAISGTAACTFDNTSTAGDYVQISTGTAGNCHDTGSAIPSVGGIIIGRVSSGGAAGSRNVQIALTPPSGAPAFPVTIVGGVSGAVPYFSSTTVESVSALLAANSPVLGGGAGTAPKTVAGITSDGVSVLTLGVAGASVGSFAIKNATSGTITISPPTGALVTPTLTWPITTGTLFESAGTNTGAASFVLDASASTTAPSLKLPQVVGGTILAGTSTAALSAPIVIQNTNSSNNNTSITMGITAPGTSTGQTVLNVNGATTGGDLVDFGTGGTWTAGVLSGQTITDAFTPTGSMKLGTAPAVTTPGTGFYIFGTEGTEPASIASGTTGFVADSTSHCMMVWENAVNQGCVPSVLVRQIKTADWSCGTTGTVSSCVAAQTIGTLTWTLPLVAADWSMDCTLIVGQATGVTANNWNLQTATNGATNVEADFSQETAATVIASGVTTGQASTTTTFNIGGTWTQGGTGTKMPAKIHATIEGASASGTVVNLQLVAPTVGDLVTIYRGSSCTMAMKQ